ncbi:MAG: carbon-monoxide dehydrogenase catalytic subunit [Firmicutes bacterium HGW-Firmicutes-14]|nr:MAG: carbon-monoxide dehydrogenase catalytic subunit [Firmicutes bacterium HGW-Firmicutes-14]
MADRNRNRLDGRVSIHDSVRKMYEILREDGMNNTFDRYEPQEKIRCNYCLTGVSCQFCTNGPCRISSEYSAELGVCGIGPDAMAMRDMLLRNIMGASAYAHHAYEAYRTLKSTAEGKTPFNIMDRNKLYWFAGRCGIATNGTPEQVALGLGNFLMYELHRGYGQSSKIIDAFTPVSRQKLWRDLGIYPTGILFEIKDAAASCLTNTDGDFVSLARKAMCLGISTVYGAQVGLEMVQDILLGTPEPHEAEVDLGVLEPDYVNIVFNGHQPWVGFATYYMARDSKVQQFARDAGAKGLRIIGSCETGQEMMQRLPADEIFRGLTGNWLTIEPALATGTIDVFVMDTGSSPPNLKPYETKYGVKLVTVGGLVRLPGVERNLAYKPSEAGSLAETLIGMAVENFRQRKGNAGSGVPQNTNRVIAGFSTESLLNMMGGDPGPLVMAIKEGKLKGIAALVNGTTLSTGPHDYMAVKLAGELIKRDILVVSCGSGSIGLGAAGLSNNDAAGLAGPGLQEICRNWNIPPALNFGTSADAGRVSMLITLLADRLGIDPADMPAAVSVSQYLDQKGLIYAMFALPFGLYTHLSPFPQVTGGPRVLRFLTEGLEKVTGGKAFLSDDPKEAAWGIEKHIIKKRIKIGLD